MPPSYTLRHRPLITPRIEFNPAPPTAFPTLTSRMDFSPDRFKLKRPHVQVEDPIIPAGETKQPRHRRSCTPEASPSPSRDETPIHDYDPDETPGPSTTTGSTNLIPKPRGEPGRPSSGGFCLEAILIEQHHWSKASVDQLLKLVKAEAKESLNLAGSFSKQNKEKIKAVCDKVQKVWPQLAQYEECWPVISALKLALKYQAESSRKAQARIDGERLRAAVAGMSY